MPSTPIPTANKHTLGGRAIVVQEGPDGKSHSIITLSSPAIAGSSFTGTVVGVTTFNEGSDGAEYIARLRTVFGL
jgi:hypothetical protein